MFRAAKPDGDHHQAEGKTAGPGGESMHGNNDDGPGENTDDDGWNAVQQVGGVADEHGKCFTSEFGQVNASQESDRDADQNRDPDGDAAAHDGVGQTSAGLTGRKGQLGEEIPIQRTETVPDQKAKNHEEDRHRYESAHTGEGQHYIVDEVSTLSSAHQSCVDPFLVVATISNWAEAFKMMVIKKRTNPSATRAAG